MKETLKELGPLESPPNKTPLRQLGHSATKKPTAFVPSFPQQVDSPVEQDRTRTEDVQFVNELLKEDKYEVSRYVLNLLEDIRGLRTENRKLKK